MSKRSILYTLVGGLLPLAASVALSAPAGAVSGTCDSPTDALGCFAGNGWWNPKFPHSPLEPGAPEPCGYFARVGIWYSPTGRKETQNHYYFRYCGTQQNPRICSYHENTGSAPTIIAPSPYFAFYVGSDEQGLDPATFRYYPVDPAVMPEPDSTYCGRLTHPSE